MDCKTPEQKEILYKCAETLLRITHSLKNIDDDASFKALQLSDQVMKILESCDCGSPSNEPISFINTPVQQQAPPEQCCSQPETDKSIICNGHTNNPQDNQECYTPPSNETTTPTPNNSIDDEVEFLVNKIRKELTK